MCGFSGCAAEGQAVGETIICHKGGFYTAVNGIYNKMASPALYGKNLSYELVDVISSVTCLCR